MSLSLETPPPATRVPSPLFSPTNGHLTTSYESEIESIIRQAVDAHELSLGRRNLNGDISLFFSDAIQSSYLQGLNPCFEAVNLSAARIDVTGMSTLFETIARCCLDQDHIKLKKIILRDCNLTHKEFGSVIAKLITETEGTVKELDVGDCQLGVGGLHALVSANFTSTSMLPSSSSLATVEHMNAQMIYSIYQLMILDLSGNNIGDMGILSLCKGMASLVRRHQPINIQILRLNRNSITDHGAQCITQQLMLMVSSTVSNAATTVYDHFGLTPTPLQRQRPGLLYDNSFVNGSSSRSLLLPASAGSSSAVEAVSGASMVASASADDNHYEEGATSGFHSRENGHHALSYMKLQELDLDDNSIGVTGIHSLLTIIPTYSSLQVLSLARCQPTFTILEILSSILSANTTMIDFVDLKFTEQVAADTMREVRQMKALGTNSVSGKLLEQPWTGAMRRLVESVKKRLVRTTSMRSSIAAAGTASAPTSAQSDAVSGRFRIHLGALPVAMFEYTQTRNESDSQEVIQEKADIIAALDALYAVNEVFRLPIAVQRWINNDHAAPSSRNVALSALATDEFAHWSLARQLEFNDETFLSPDKRTLTGNDLSIPTAPVSSLSPQQSQQSQQPVSVAMDVIKVFADPAVLKTTATMKLDEQSSEDSVDSESSDLPTAATTTKTGATPQLRLISPLERSMSSTEMFGVTQSALSTPMMSRPHSSKTLSTTSIDGLSHGFAAASTAATWSEPRVFSFRPEDTAGAIEVVSDFGSDAVPTAPAAPVTSSVSSGMNAKEADRDAFSFSSPPRRPADGSVPATTSQRNPLLEVVGTEASGPSLSGLDTLLLSPSSRMALSSLARGNGPNNFDTRHPEALRLKEEDVVSQAAKTLSQVSDRIVANGIKTKSLVQTQTQPQPSPTSSLAYQEPHPLQQQPLHRPMQAIQNERFKRTAQDWNTARASPAMGQHSDGLASLAAPSPAHIELMSLARPSPTAASSTYSAFQFEEVNGSFSAPTSSMSSLLSANDFIDKRVQDLEKMRQEKMAAMRRLAEAANDLMMSTDMISVDDLSLSTSLLQQQQIPMSPRQRQIELKQLQLNRLQAQRAALPEASASFSSVQQFHEMSSRAFQDIIDDQSYAESHSDRPLQIADLMDTSAAHSAGKPTTSMLTEEDINRLVRQAVSDELRSSIIPMISRDTGGDSSNSSSSESSVPAAAVAASDAGTSESKVTDPLPPTPKAAVKGRLNFPVGANSPVLAKILRSQSLLTSGLEDELSQSVATNRAPVAETPTAFPRSPLGALVHKIDKANKFKPAPWSQDASFSEIGSTSTTAGQGAVRAINIYSPKDSIRIDVTLPSHSQPKAEPATTSASSPLGTEDQKILELANRFEYLRNKINSLEQQLAATDGSDDPRRSSQQQNQPLSPSSPLRLQTAAVVERSSFSIAPIIQERDSLRGALAQVEQQLSGLLDAQTDPSKANRKKEEEFADDIVSATRAIPPLTLRPTSALPPPPSAVLIASPTPELSRKVNKSTLTSPLYDALSSLVNPPPSRSVYGSGQPQQSASVAAAGSQTSMQSPQVVAKSDRTEMPSARASKTPEESYSDLQDRLKNLESALEAEHESTIKVLDILLMQNQRVQTPASLPSTAAIAPKSRPATASAAIEAAKTPDALIAASSGSSASRSGKDRAGGGSSSVNSNNKALLIAHISTASPVSRRGMAPELAAEPAPVPARSARDVAAPGGSHTVPATSRPTSAPMTNARVAAIARAVHLPKPHILPPPPLAPVSKKKKP